jgi:hypothetical protein
MRKINQKRLFILLALTIVFLSFGLAIGQGTGPVFSLQLAPGLEFAQVVYVSDFDFYQQGATIFLFQATLDNTGKNAAQGYLVIEILRGSEVISRAQTNVFTISANEVISASNIQISNGVMTQSGDQINLDQTQTYAPGTEFENEVYSSGKLPKGEYQLVGRFRFNNDTQETIAPLLYLHVQNPSYIRPIMPGYNAGSGSVDIVYTQFPTFQFETDFDPNDVTVTEPPFLVSIYKKLDQHYSIDEVLTSTPQYEELTYQTVFPYQAFGVQPLEPGEYVWRVQLRYLTTSGTEVLESPVFVFQVEDPSKIGMFENEGVKEDLMQFLVQNNEDKDEAREIAQMLSDYKLISIKLNGKEISKEKFYEILDQYGSELKKISDLILTPTQQ